MKKLLYLGIVLMFASCGSDESESTAPTVNVDGKEFSTIKIGDLEVMTEDLGEMDWASAIELSESLPDGWRLPTKYELNILYENKDSIGGFVTYTYWSSSIKTDYGENHIIPWDKGFANPGETVTTEEGQGRFRAVRGGNEINDICDCVDMSVAMMNEMKGIEDMGKMTEITEKYAAQAEKCEKMGEGKSEEEIKAMEEEMKGCASFKELEKMVNLK